MTEYTMSRFVIALLVVGLFASVFGLFLYWGSSPTTGYDVDYDESTLDDYQEIDRLNAVIADSNVTVDSTPNALDILGQIFQQGYTTAKTTYVATASFISMGSSITSNPANPLGNAATIFQSYLFAIVTAIILIGVLLRWLIKDRT